MNTASRMESTGVPGRIHVSKETAELLRTAGKEAWLNERPGGVEAKGKGFLSTYFLCLTTGGRRGTGATISASSENSDDSVSAVDQHCAQCGTDYIDC